MQFKARYVYEVNGIALASEVWSYDSVADGQYILKLPPLSRSQIGALVEALGNPAAFMAVSISIHGLPTVAEMATRLAAVEKALSYSGPIGKT